MCISVTRKAGDGRETSFVVVCDVLIAKFSPDVLHIIHRVYPRVCIYIYICVCVCQENGRRGRTDTRGRKRLCYDVYAYRYRTGCLFQTAFPCRHLCFGGTCPCLGAYAPGNGFSDGDRVRTVKFRRGGGATLFFYYRKKRNFYSTRSAVTRRENTRFYIFKMCRYTLYMKYNKHA